MSKSIISNFLKALTLGLALWSCNSTTEVTVARQDMILTVFGLDGEPAANATVVLFDNEAIFYTQNYTFGTKGSKKTATTDSEGKVRFDSLSTEVNYFVLAYTIDSLSFKPQGYRIFNDNSLTGFEFQQKLNKSATTYANVYLTPAEAIVSFYASNFNPQGVPVQIFIENASLGTITGIQTITSGNIPLNPASNPIQNGVITAKIRLGAEPAAIKYINAFECNNIGSVNATPGGFTPINVNLCDAGVVNFSGDDTFPITITLNGDNNIGILNSSTLPNSRNLRRTLEPGDYTYEASAPNCSWQGKFTVKSNTIENVILKKCI